MLKPEFFSANIVDTSPFDPHYASDNHPGWNKLKECYEKFMWGGRVGGNIPLTIHFIWLGGDIPPKYLDNSSDWADINPEFKIQWWTDETVAGFDFPQKELFEGVKNVGAKSDILRYAVLLKHGGLYVDTDFLCLDNFYELNRSVSFYSGICLEKEPQINNGIIGCEPGHPIIQACLDTLDVPLDPTISEVMCQTGPWHFTKHIMNYVEDKRDGLVLFPANFFYPFPALYRHNPSIPQIYNYVKPYSKAIHLWHTAWQK